MSGGFVASAVAVGVLLAVAGHHGGTAEAAPGKAAAAAIAYARAQLGCPYVWGGTGPCGAGFDCSGLVVMAYRQSGITFGSSRPTAAVEWAYGPKVSTPEPGDLVFYPGADGTWTSPGHVALVVGGGRMIEAYGTGYPVREVPIRPGMVGFTDPAGGS